MCLLALTAVCALLAVLFFKGGPYVRPNAYEKNSLRVSWWGARYLKTEHCVEVEDSREDTEALGCFKVVAESTSDKVPSKSKDDESIDEPETNRALINMDEMQPVACENKESNQSNS